MLTHTRFAHRRRVTKISGIHLLLFLLIFPRPNTAFSYAIYQQCYHQYSTTSTVTTTFQNRMSLVMLRKLSNKKRSCDNSATALYSFNRENKAKTIVPTIYPHTQITRSKARISRMSQTDNDHHDYNDCNNNNGKAKKVPLQSLAFVFLSQIILFIGAGAVIPTLPVYATSVDLSSVANGSTISVQALALLPIVLKGLKLTSGLVCMLASIIGLLLYVKQDSILYHPTIQNLPKKPRNNPKGYCSPAEYRVPFETHRIKCEDGVYIHSWLMQNKSNTNTHEPNMLPTILFFHGNAGNIGIRLPNAVQMMKHLNANILLVEYRGFGESDDAKVNEAGLKLDAEAALRFAATHTQIDPNQVFVFGRSLGGGVAFHLAHYAEQQGISLAGVMVENTFLSISKMVDALMPYVAPFKALVLRIGWDSLEIAPRLNTPILYLAGEADELVPPSHMRGLYDASTKSRLRVWHGIKGGSHNESWVQGGTEYWLAMRMFIEKALAVSASCSKSVGHGSGFEVDALNGQPVESSIPVMKSGLVGMLSEAFSGSNGKSAKKVT